MHPDMHPCIYGQLNYVKMLRIYNEEIEIIVSSINGGGKTRQIQKNITDYYLTEHKN